MKNKIKARLGLDLPISYNDFTDMYSAIDSIYTDCLNKNHKSEKENNKLFIYGIEKGSIILELAPQENILFEEVNMQAEFINDLGKIIQAIEEENYNKLPSWVSTKTISQVNKLLSPLKDKIKGEISFSVGEQEDTKLVIEPLQAKDIINKIPQVRVYIESDTNIPTHYNTIEFIWDKTLHNKENEDTIIANDISKKGIPVIFRNLDDKIFCKRFNQQKNVDWQDMIYVADIDAHNNKKDEIIKYEIISVYQNESYPKPKK